MHHAGDSPVELAARTARARRQQRLDRSREVAAIVQFVLVPTVAMANVPVANCAYDQKHGLNLTAFHNAFHIPLSFQSFMISGIMELL